jgi:hypothetical protein
MKNAKILTVLLGAIFMIPAVGLADIFMKEKVHQGGYEVMGQKNPEKDYFRTTWITPEKMISNDDQRSIIVRLDQNAFYIVDHTKNTYMQMPLNFGETMNKKLEQEMQKEGMDDENMKKFMDMAKGMMQVEMTVTPTDEKKQIGDWNCRKYIQKLNTGMGETTSEVWATEELEIDSELYAKFASAMMGQQSGAGKATEEMVEELKKIKGVPVLTKTKVNMMGTTMETVRELVEYKQEGAPSGIFDIPEGYKKEEMDRF